MNSRVPSTTRRAAAALAVTSMGAVLLAFIFGKQAYDWIKALHVIAVMAWMAGMLYLPRLFVYHADAKVGSELSETFKVMERRLLHVIVNPAMVIAWMAGLWLAWQAGFWKDGWFQLKLGAVILLSVTHGYLSAAARAFAEDRNEKSASHWRIINEVPTVLMIAIVVLVILKPI